MGQYTQLNHRQTIENRYKDLFNLTRSCCLSQRSYLDRRRTIQESNAYQRLTVYNREYMRGMESMFFLRLYQDDLIFCYDYQEKRYAIDTAEYKTLSPKEVADNSTFHGHCYRKDLTKAY